MQNQKARRQINTRFSNNRYRIKGARQSNFSRPTYKTKDFLSDGFSQNRWDKSTPTKPSRRFSGGSSPFRSRSPYGRSRSNGNFRRSRNQGRGFRGEKIDYKKYITKATEVTKEPTSLYVTDYTFSDLKVAEAIKKNILAKGYVHPTKIQDQTIQHILDGRDVLGMACTGSGKTAAFLIPLINKILNDRSQRCLIIVPTRELAVQIKDEFLGFSKGLGLFATIVIGGESISNQVYNLRRNPQFVMGTPGRLKDLVERKALNLSGFNNIVLDEVDRMLDMGFIEDIRHLISLLKTKKQSLFFSATMNREAESVANSLLNNPVRVQTEKQLPLKNIDQDVIKVSSVKEKVEKLNDLLIQEEFKKVLIFTRTKHGADRLSGELNERGFKVDSIHGDKSQYKRSKVIVKFKQEMIKILVATDVAARGLDISNITHVINYDEPANFEDYIHRIGRTGRVGKKGMALTFVEGRRS